MESKDVVFKLFVLGVGKAVKSPLLFWLTTITDQIEAIILNQWFSKFSMDQNYLKGLFKKDLWASATFRDSVGLR